MNVRKARIYIMPLILAFSALVACSVQDPIFNQRETVSLTKPALSSDTDKSGSDLSTTSPPPTLAVPSLCTAEPLPGWRCYQDLDYVFALDYQADWTVRITIDDQTPGKIVRRHTFAGPEGYVDIDIWLANELTLPAWLEWYSDTRNPLPLTQPNAAVAGLPAVVFIEEGKPESMFSVYFSDGEHVFRLWYTLSCHEAGLEAFRRMLDSFHFSSHAAISVDVSESIWKDALRIVETTSNSGPQDFPCPTHSHDR